MQFGGASIPADSGGKIDGSGKSRIEISGTIYGFPGSVWRVDHEAAPNQQLSAIPGGQLERSIGRTREKINYPLRADLPQCLFVITPGHGCCSPLWVSRILV